MNIEELKSDLKMDNFYFSEITMKRNKVVLSGKYSIDLEKKIRKIGEHEYDAQLILTIEKEDFYLIMKANALFFYEGINFAREEMVIQNNTVAMMFPFIKSQVVLMTSQPGMAPILLPPINTAKLR